MNRLLAVARLHTVAWQGTLAWPWVIMASRSLVNLAALRVHRGRRGRTSRSPAG